jgi:hypothetical protein
MHIYKFIYPIFVIDQNNKPIQFCGTAFPITPDGGMITCLHTVDRKLEPSPKLVLRDSENDRFIPLSQYKSLEGYDLAFFTNAIPDKKEYFPVLSPEKVLIGEDAITMGMFSVGGVVSSVDKGYFRGNIINIYRNPNKSNCWSMVLPYPVIEGLSGSPVYTAYNGTKLIGICYGSVSQRIIASEVVEFDEDGKKSTESVTRIVEFGQAYVAGEIINFLARLAIPGITISEKDEHIPNLD